MKPVLVDFWAPWCGPCRTLGPIIEKLAAESAEKWTLVKINSDVHPELSSQYEVKGIPAVKLFYRGVVIDEFTGVLPEYAIQAVQAGRPDEAIPLLVDVLKTNRMLDDDGARKLGVALFTVLGASHPVTLAHRRTFDMWLY